MPLSTRLCPKKPFSFTGHIIPVSVARRGLVCQLAGPLPQSVISLMGDFRLMVNRGIREALEKKVTSRGSLNKFGQILAREYRLNGKHATTAMTTALTIDKGHLRRIRKGRGGKIPYCLKPFLIADDETFHLDPNTGHVRLSLRNGEWVGFDMKLSDYHRAALASGKVKQLRLKPGRAVVIVEKEIPDPYAPASLVALDTNETSLDGVVLRGEKAVPVTIPYSEVRRIQQVHFQRRRMLGRKKAHDRRVGKRLGGREGRREHHRIEQRLHLISKGIVQEAASQRATIVLEDLHLPKGGGRGRKMRRRLSSWPQRELHRQIEYKAEERGVPLLWVNPSYTSKTCPRCGEVKERRSRVGRVFVCGKCGWRCDRQVNAGLNICRTVLREAPQGPENAGLRGLELDLDGLPKDVRRLLYAQGNARAQERNGWEGRLLVGPRTR